MGSQFLMLPMSEADDLKLYSLKEKRPCNLNILQNLKDLRCVGSWDGSLAFLDHKANPFLLNPFTSSRIHLPLVKTLPHRQRTSTIVKLALSHHAVVVMYSAGLHTKIAFCRQGDAEWRALDCKALTYYDVVFCDRTNLLYALSPGPRVESWDLTHPIPQKTIVIEDICPRSAYQTFPSDLYSTQWYLALSPRGQILLIVRYIGEFVRDDGEVVTEGDTLTDYAAEPLVCPYKTVGFRVFRVEGGEWRDVESLDEFAVFLGGNQSMVMWNEQAKRNAIYFTDDYRERIDEDYSYGGHDIGVYSMDDGSIEPVVEDLPQKIQPPPVWVTCPHRLQSSSDCYLMENSPF